MFLRIKRNRYNNNSVIVWCLLGYKLIFSLNKYFICSAGVNVNIYIREFPKSYYAILYTLEKIAYTHFRYDTKSVKVNNTYCV